MRAVRIETITPAKEITLTEVPVPEVKPGWVLVKVRAFGLNHSEQILRQEEIEASYIQKPVIPGIECVGEVADPGDTRFVKGQKVCALMGGMGRSFHGSYAEYALLPEHHVFVMNTGLSWEEAGAVPETYFTAWGSLFECLRLKAASAQRARELLGLVELPEPAEQMGRYPHQLSGGQRQRVMIAMALACEPKLLIADEPTTALDTTIQAQILGLLQKLQRQLGMSLLLITHDLAIVAGIADRMQVMYGGQIVERGATAELFHNPRHPYTAALLSAIPRQGTAHRDKLYALPGAPPDLRLELNCCPFAARCQYAMPVCKKQRPAETGETHRVSCWPTDTRAPKVDLGGGAPNV